MKERLCCCLLVDKVVHPHSLNKFSNDTDLVNPVTRQVASFWIFCKVCESCSEHPSHKLRHILQLVKEMTYTGPLQKLFHYAMIQKFFHIFIIH